MNDINICNKVRKAVIPAAGLGTRVLPVSKAMPKEIACSQIGSKSSSLFFSVSFLESFSPGISSPRGRITAAAQNNQIVDLTTMANICFVRQKETKGLGHAVNCARSFVGDEPFAILFGDDVILGDDPVTAQLCRAYEKYGLGVVGTKEMPPEVVMRGSSLKLELMQDETNIFRCTDLVEKVSRTEDLLSNYTILGRCVCPPEIFDILDHTPPGAGNEIQLTDALAQLAKTKGLAAVDFNGKRYDMGNKLGILQATVDVALKHPEVSEGFKAYLKEIYDEL